MGMGGNWNIYVRANRNEVLDWEWVGIGLTPWEEEQEESFPHKSRLKALPQPLASHTQRSSTAVVRPMQKSIGKWEIRPPVKS